jgi:hypothetical protein
MQLLPKDPIFGRAAAATAPAAAAGGGAGAGAAGADGSKAGSGDDVDLLIQLAADIREYLEPGAQPPPGLRGVAGWSACCAGTSVH